MEKQLIKFMDDKERISAGMAVIGSFTSDDGRVFEVRNWSPTISVDDCFLTIKLEVLVRMAIIGVNLKSWWHPAVGCGVSPGIKKSHMVLHMSHPMGKE